jgi:putative ABC transport system ATP-binding protein
MPEPYVICDNLVKIHKISDLEVVALQGLDLVVETGELIAVVGASGSGKSTLMSVLGGLERPSAGRVWVGGHDLLKLTDRQMDDYRRQNVGFVWQQGARNLVPYLTARENVELPMMLNGRADRKTRRARELLNAVGLSHRINHRLAELSGGEQQRVAIAVALANEPRLLLADEPTGEVDSTTAEVIYETFRALNREMGITTIIVSHDPDVARHVGRVVAISDGRLATETIRRTRESGGAKSDAAQSDEVHHEYHELAVLDSAGRVQVPKTYLEHFNIRGRVQVDLVDDGILIRPAPEEVDRARNAEHLITDMIRSRKVGGLRGVIQRWFEKRS